MRFRLSLLLCMCFSISLHADTLDFAISDNNPPYNHVANGQVRGIIPDVLKLIFSYLPNEQVQLYSFPWARAQLEVKNNRRDGLLPYPSVKRKVYADFTPSPALFMDYGFLIYHKKNSHRETLENAASFDDLRDLSVIVQTGVGWEEDNIPKYIKRKVASSIDAAMHYLLNRKFGDFLIMPPEQAKHIANKFGYSDNLKFKQVSFIQNSAIPFHIGIRKKHPKNKQLLLEIEEVLQREDVRLAINKMLNDYR